VLNAARGAVSLNRGRGVVVLNEARGAVAFNGGERGRVCLDEKEAWVDGAESMLLAPMRSWPMEDRFFSSRLYGAVLKGVNLVRKSCTRRL